MNKKIKKLILIGMLTAATVAPALGAGTFAERYKEAKEALKATTVENQRLHLEKNQEILQLKEQMIQLEKSKNDVINGKNDEINFLKTSLLEKGDEISNLKTAHEDDKNTLRNEKDDEINALRILKDTEISKNNDAYRNQVQELNAKYATEIAELNRKYSELVNTKHLKDIQCETEKTEIRDQLNDSCSQAKLALQGEKDNCLDQLTECEGEAIHCAANLLTKQSMIPSGVACEVARVFPSLAYQVALATGKDPIEVLENNELFQQYVKQSYPELTTLEITLEGGKVIINATNSTNTTTTVEDKDLMMQAAIRAQAELLIKGSTI